MTTLRETLEQRGIAQAADAAGWKEHALYGRDGWLYSVQSSKLPGHSRWKSGDGKSPKYLWQPKDADERPRYYFVNGIKAAIAGDNGRLYLAGGEPDVLTFAAAGAHNALCFFGEKSVPESLVADLKALGVVEVVYAFDRDNTGRAASEQVASALDGTGIDYRALALPGTFGDHYDVNRLWIDVEFDTDKFWQRINNLEVVNVEREYREIDWAQAYETWCVEVEQQAVNAWAVDQRRKKEWSRTLFLSPLREEQEPSARWHYEAHGFKDFGTNEFYNTHQVADLLDAERWEDYKQRLIRDYSSAPLLYQDMGRDAVADAIQTKATHEQKPQVKPSDDVRVVSSDDALSTVMDWLNGAVPPSEPILSPYPAMHQLGGMAHLWERRKLIYVIGAAGMGKTAFMETGADKLRQRGFSVIYWGPEWTPEEVQMKAIARYGGPSFLAQRLDHLWHQEDIAKVPDSRRQGKRMSDADRSNAYKIACDIALWPGKAWYIDQANVPLETIMEMVKTLSDKARGQGQKMAAFFCDYLQKARLPGAKNSWHELEDKANVISYGCIEANLVGVVASQVGKTDSRQLRRNTRLDAGSAQGLSDQLCNLYIALNPVFDKQGNRLEKAILGVEKNSSGYAPAAVTVKTALHRHFFSDEITRVEADEQYATTFADKAAGDDD